MKWFNWIIMSLTLAGVPAENEYDKGSIEDEDVYDEFSPEIPEVPEHRMRHETTFVLGKKEPPNDVENSLSWWDYQIKYHRNYGWFERKFTRRFNYLSSRHSVYRANYKYDNNKRAFFSEVNEFSDWNSKELSKLLGLSDWQYSDHMCKGNVYQMKENVSLPEEFDWEKDGFVVPPEHQDKCLADYAFAALSALGSHVAIKKKTLVRKLSAQQIVDCSRHYKNKGCYGGSPAYVFDFLRHEKEINYQDDYPYVGRDQSCMTKKTEEPTEVTCTGCRMIPTDNEEALRQALVTEGPVVAAVYANYELFNYKGGVFDYSGCQQAYLNHAVLVVGYGRDKASGLDFWRIKNSWGRNWGENGYFRLWRNKRNFCGIATHALFPEVSS